MPNRALDLPEPTGPTLADYFGWLRRRWWILAIAAVLGTLAAAGFTAVQPREYTSKTSVLVQTIGLNSTVTRINLDTEAQLLRSLVVAARAKALMRSELSAEELLAGVSVTVPPNSQVLEVTYEAPTAALARDGSHSFTQAYLDLRSDVARRELDTEIAGIRQQIDTVNRQLTDTASRIAVLPTNSVDRQRAEADRNVLTQQLATLNARLSPLLTAQLVPGSIITDAQLPTEPSSPNTLLNLASGFGAGLLLGIAFALLLDRLDTRIRRGRDIAQRIGLDVLLEVPYKISSVGLLPAVHRLSREFGRLRNVLLTTVPDKAPGVRGRVLLVSAATSGSATGFVVGNLAAAYARTGAQVAVLTTNLNSPLAQVLDGDAPHGLADVLRHDVPTLKALTAVPAVPQLRMLLPGELSTEDELPIAGLVEVLTELSARFDHVLIETGPPSVVVEAQALAGHVDAVLLVAESRRTRSSEVVDAVHQFEQVDAPVLGAVLVPHIPDGSGRRKLSLPRSGRRSELPASLPPAGTTPATPGKAAAAAEVPAEAVVDGDTTVTLVKPAAKAKVQAKPAAKAADATEVLPRIANGSWAGMSRNGTAVTNGKAAKKAQLSNRRDTGGDQE